MREKSNCSASNCLKKSLKIGLAEAVVTPPVGVKLSGFSSRTEPSISILDNLYAKALVMDDSRQRLALVVCDLLWVERDMVKDVRKRIGEMTGLKEENVMITATHTHFGPALGSAGEAYVENLKSQMAGAVYAACNNMKNARIGFSRGSCLMGSNRRNPKSPYGAHYLYSWPEGTMDPTVMVMRIEDISRRVIGVLVNYSCHPVSLGRNELRISRDYPGFALQVLEKAWNHDIIAIFMNGCCGNINPRWIWDRPDLSPAPKREYSESPEERFIEMRRLGHILGGEALKTVESITSLTSDLRLKTGLKEVELPLREDIPEESIENAKHLKKEGRAVRRRDVILSDAAEGKKNITTEVQVFCLGENFIVGIPGEVFVEYQMEIRKRLNAPFTFVSELSNDTITYVPTPEAYPQGGYEPKVSLLAPEAGGILVDSACSLAEELRKI
jgi:neutral ceramidase